MDRTCELARRVAAADGSHWAAWMSAVRDIEGNPFGVEVRRIGGAVSLFVEAIPVTQYNRVIQLGADDIRELPRIARYYAERFSPFRVDVSPYQCDGALLDALATIGLYPTEFQTNLVGTPTRRRRSYPRGVEARRVRADEIEFFTQLYEHAYYEGRSPSRVAEFRAASIKVRFAKDDWHFFMVSVDGIPAGGGAVHIQDGIATLAGGATVPTMRGRGCQGVLLQARIDAAIEAGCELVIGRCAVGSVSQRNMERAGLETVFTKTIWQHRWPAATGDLALAAERARVPA